MITDTALLEAVIKKNVAERAGAKTGNDQSDRASRLVSDNLIIIARAAN